MAYIICRQAMIIDPKFPYRSAILSADFDPQFVFTPELRLKAHDFALRQYKTSDKKYSTRHQNDPFKVVQDIQVGKLGEDGDYRLLKKPGLLTGLTSPDWEIYGARDKNWNSDMIDLTIVPAIKVGVKSQTVEGAAQFGTSWMFEFRADRNYDVDRGVFGEEAKNPGNFIFFNSIDLKKLTGRLEAIIAVSTLHELKLFEAPVKESLRDNKVAVYLKTLREKIQS